MGQAKATATLTERLTKGKKQKGGGSKKIGRNKVKCAHYRVARSVKNKLRKLNRHLAVHSNDACAKSALAKAR